jgi:hypothetical protein
MNAKSLVDAEKIGDKPRLDQPGWISLEKRSRRSAPVAARSRGPQAADRRRVGDERADATMPGTSLQAARIVRPLHRIDDRVQTGSHQIAQMPSPSIFALHVHSDSMPTTTPADKSQFLGLRL